MFGSQFSTILESLEGNKGVRFLEKKKKICKLFCSQRKISPKAKPGKFPSKQPNFRQGKDTYLGKKASFTPNIPYQISSLGFPPSYIEVINSSSNSSL
ncbi:hypothetical protein GDO81_016060 [Engystomops pustulosus]|uniref:Uncharacterized protein n=1 Tax=Engystomops pustulosus TaxID=76066 RepID=A0AAV7APE1_ENGPU|nr:hypothetical protein GDO81_016060 [Engystomops pustulosus]